MSNNKSHLSKVVEAKQEVEVDMGVIKVKSWQWTSIMSDTVFCCTSCSKKEKKPLFIAVQCSCSDGVKVQSL